MTRLAFSWKALQLTSAVGGVPSNAARCSLRSNDGSSRLAAACGGLPSAVSDARSLAAIRWAAWAEEVEPQVEPIALFILQFLWFLFAWSLIAYFGLWPWSATLSPDARLSAWVAPEMFRVLGVGLLVPSLSPGMPAGFAIPTAAADSLTAVLAASAFLGLQRGWGAARGLAWACTLVGSLDLLIAFPHAASTGAISHLATQWYVPVFAGPPLVICHVACFILLVRGRRGG